MHARWKALGSSLKTALWWTPVALTVNDCLVGAATIDGHSMQPALNPGTAQSRMVAVCSTTIFNGISCNRLITGNRMLWPMQVPRTQSETACW